MVTDVYMQYFKAECEAAEVPRRGAAVRLTADSEAGHITYEISVSFFPHEDDEDFRITGDVSAGEEVYSAKGRRSKKREKVFMDSLRVTADRLAEGLAGSIFWDEPLIEARLG